MVREIIKPDVLRYYREILKGGNTFFEGMNDPLGKVLFRYHIIKQFKRAKVE